MRKWLADNGIVLGPLVLGIIGAVAMSVMNWSRSKDNSKEKAAVFVSFLCLTAVLAIQSVQLYGAREASQAIQKQLSDANAMLLQAVAKLGDDSMREKYLGMVQKWSAGIAEGDAEKWRKELEASREQRIAEKKSVAEALKEKAAKLELRWMPVYQYVVDQFDSRTKALVDAGIVTKVETADEEPQLVWIDKRMQPYEIRRFTLPNDYSMVLAVYPAIYAGGQFERGATIGVEMHEPARTHAL